MPRMVLGANLLSPSRGFRHQASRCGLGEASSEADPLDLREVKPSPIEDIGVSYKRDGGEGEVYIVIISKAQAEVMFPEGAIIHRIEGPGKFILTRDVEGAEKVKKV